MEKLLRESEKCRYTSFYCTLLYNGFFFVLQIEGLWQPCVSSKSTGAIFPKAFAHLMILCHILVILAIFQTLLLHLLWWSVISDLWCLYGSTTNCTYIRQQTINVVCGLTTPLTSYFLHLSSSSWASLLPDTQQYWN